MCPMHQRGTNDTTGKTHCALRNACSPDLSAIVAMVALTGLASDRAAIEMTAGEAAVVASVHDPLDEAAIPESPPPRS